MKRVLAVAAMVLAFSSGISGALQAATGPFHSVSGGMPVKGHSFAHQVLIVEDESAATIRVTYRQAAYEYQIKVDDDGRIRVDYEGTNVSKSGAVATVKGTLPCGPPNEYDPETNTWSPTGYTSCQP